MEALVQTGVNNPSRGTLAADSHYGLRIRICAGPGTRALTYIPQSALRIRTLGAEGVGVRFRIAYCVFVFRIVQPALGSVPYSVFRIPYFGLELGLRVVAYPVLRIRTPYCRFESGSVFRIVYSYPVFQV